MAIREYSLPNGEVRFEVYVTKRSEVNPGIRAQRRKRNIPTRAAAEREERQLARVCDREIFERESAGSTWGAVVDAFRAYLCSETAKKLNEKTREDYLASVTTHTSSWWNGSAASISQRDVNDLLNMMIGEGYSRGHVTKVGAVIRKVFQYGMEKHLIHGLSHNPALHLNVRKSEKIEKATLDIHQIKRLLACAKAVNHPWYYIWALALYTGMRNGELYALQWDSIDWTNGLITVRQSYNKQQKVYKCPKAGYSRQVPISQDLRQLLLELRATAEGRTEVLPRINHWAKGEQARELRKFCLGIGLPSIRFHDLRACFATQLIRNNVPPIQLQKICGWKDLKTMQRYIRLAGIEITGATDSLKLLPDSEIMEIVSDALQDPDEEA